MGCAHKQNQDGFTLVEISIVMIIIGLLIGGTFGGMKLIENMQVNKTVQDLKAIESASLTFKDTYGRLPGDLVNPAARLPNCTTAPCNVTGDGNRRIGPANGWTNVSAITATDERLAAWHHLAAADLMKAPGPGASLEFGDGQPDSPYGGYRWETYTNGTNYAGIPDNTVRGHMLIVTGLAWEVYTTQTSFNSVPCYAMTKIDRKMDNGHPLTGRVSAVHGQCYTAPASMASTYIETGTLSPMRVLMRF